MLRTLIIIFVSIILIGGAGYLYASSGVKSKPGYVELVSPGSLKGESVNVLFAMNLGPKGMTPVRWVVEKMASQADRVLETSEQVLLSLLREIQGVQLRVYEVRNNRKVFDNAINDSAAALKEKNWHPLIKVNDDEEHVVIMQFGDEKEITALSVMVSTPENAVFLNLIGPFNPQEIAATVSQIH